MPSESVPSVEAPPAASEQTRAAQESADNVSSAQVRQMLLQREVTAAATAPAPAESVAPDAPAAPEESTPPQPAEETAKTESETAAPPATDAQPEQPEPEEQPDEVLSQLSSLDPKSREIAERALAQFKGKNEAAIAKRMAKERSKRGDVERQLEQERHLREQLQAQQAPAAQPATPPVVVPGIPLAHINSPQELVKLQQEAKQTIRFVEQSLDRDDIDQGIQVGDRTFSKRELKDRMWEAKVVLEDQIPQRAAFLQQRDQAVQAAFEKFPFYKDQSSPEFLRAQAIIKEAPAIRNATNYLEIVGNMVLGEQYREVRYGTKPAPKTAAPKARPAADQTVSGAAPGGSGRGNPDARGAAAVNAEREKIVGGGNVSSATLRQFLQRSDQLRNNSR